MPYQESLLSYSLEGTNKIVMNTKQQRELNVSPLAQKNNQISIGQSMHWMDGVRCSDLNLMA